VRNPSKHVLNNIYWNCFKVKKGQKERREKLRQEGQTDETGEEHVTNKGRMCRYENLSNT